MDGAQFLVLVLLLLAALTSKRETGQNNPSRNLYFAQDISSSRAERRAGRGNQGGQDARISGDSDANV